METQNKKSKTLGTILFILANILIIGWTAFREFSGGDGAERFRDVTIRWGFLIPALGCFCLAVAAETVKYAAVMKETSGYVDWRLARRTVLLGRYYDNITPSGIGGQPFQIYYLKKNGLSNAASAALPIAGFLSMQFSFILLALVVLIAGGGSTQSTVVRVAAFVGLFFYSFFPVMILLFTLFPSFAERITRTVTALLARLRLVKNEQQAVGRFITNVKDYSACLQMLLKDQKLCLKTLGLGLVYQIATCSIPFFVIFAFGGKVSFLDCLATTTLIYAAITFIPTPGNAGAAEGMFYAVFSMLTTGYIFWAMLLWRFFVYYLYIFVGLGLQLDEILSKRLGTGRRLQAPAVIERENTEE